MKYFLDFDGVIFDIEAFKERMRVLAVEDAPRNVNLFALMESKDPLFVVSDFVFPDALSFLKKHAPDCFVVSSYVSSNPSLNQDDEEALLYQAEKITRAGVAELLGDGHIYVVGESKNEALSKLKDQCREEGEDCVFIDDRELYVKEAQALGVRALWMDRTVRTSKSGLDTVHSFEEFDTFVA